MVNMVKAVNMNKKINYRKAPKVCMVKKISYRKGM